MRQVLNADCFFNFFGLNLISNFVSLFATDSFKYVDGCCFFKIQIDAKFKINSRNHSSTMGCKNCNSKLKSHFAISSCSYSNYQLKKIATMSCLQLKLAIYVFLQLLVELWLHSGCKNLQCTTLT